MSETRLYAAVLSIAAELDVSMVSLMQLLRKGPGVLTRPTSQRKAEKVAGIMRSAGLEVGAVSLEALDLRGHLLLEEEAPKTTSESSLLKLKDTHEIGGGAPLMTVAAPVVAPASREKEPPERSEAAVPLQGERRRPRHSRTSWILLAVVAVGVVLVALASLPGVRDLAVGLLRRPASYESGFEAYQAGDYATALTHWEEVAANGDDRAQQALGEFYRLGLGTEVDLERAIGYYLAAAERGNASAQFELAVLHYDGSGIERDYRKAATWFSWAAAQGHARAQYNLGVMLLYGQGVQADPVEATRWLRTASGQGVEAATALLAELDAADGGSTPGIVDDGETPAAQLGGGDVAAEGAPPVAVPAAPTEGDIFSAARGGTVSELDQLLTLFDAVELRDDHGQTPLMYAAGANTEAVVRLLLESGGDVNARSNSGWTALMFAVRDNPDPAVSAALLEAGADPALANGAGVSALDLAREVRPELVELLERP